MNDELQHFINSDISINACILFMKFSVYIILLNIILISCNNIITLFLRNTLQLLATAMPRHIVYVLGVRICLNLVNYDKHVVKHDGRLTRSLTRHLTRI